MRNSPWFLLLMAVVTVSVAGAALTMPLGNRKTEVHNSPWDLLLEWHREGRMPQKVAKQFIPPQAARNGIVQGLHIQVRVEDKNGTPLQGASVVCDRILANSSGRVATGLTNLDGEFATTRLVTGNYEVVVSMPGYLTSEPQCWTVPTTEGPIQTLQLARACSLEGSLQGLDGLPQNHGILLMTAQNRDMDFMSRPDAEGRFRFPQLPEGKWILSWKPHDQAEQNHKLQRGLDLVIGSTSQVQIILPAELLTPPGEQNGKSVGIYLLENN